MLTLKQFIEDVWWPKYKVGGGKRGINQETSLREKEGHIRLHILPRLGGLRLDKVNNERVTTLFGELRAEGFSKRGRPVTSSKPEAIRKRRQRDLGKGAEGERRKQQSRRPGLSEKSIRNVRATLRTLLSFAVRWGYLEHLPDLPEVVVPEGAFDWYQPSEAAELVEAARDTWERTLLLSRCTRGSGWESNARSDGRMSTSLSRVYIRRSAPSGFTTIKAPKSNRERWVDLTPELAAALRSIRHRAELIFCGDDGSMLRPGQFREVLWGAQKRAGLRRIRWHDLRHSYASILASGRMPLFLIRGLLGHSSVKMTERYAHVAASQTAAYVPLLSGVSPPPNGPPAGPSTLAPRN